MVKKRGMPMFMDGVYLLTGRLDFYLRSPRLAGESRLEALREFQKQFEGFAAFMNSRRTVASFTGKDPTHPDDEKVLDTRVQGLLDSVSKPLLGHPLAGPKSKQ
jgi:hypothetical protein